METSKRKNWEKLLAEHPVVSEEKWILARKELLLKEKELTRLQDTINQERQNLPWVKIEKNYLFDGPNGKVSLSDLFCGRSQLIVQHFMFGPDWVEGCPGCSFQADGVEGARMHFEHHDVSFVAVSRASISQIEAFKKRMGWKFPWVSASENDFNFDFHVSFNNDELASGKVYYNFEMIDAGSDELPGISVFYKDPGGQIFRTYSTFARGGERLVSTFSYLDITPKGRNENGPNFNLGDWVKHHDKYESNDDSWHPSKPVNENAVQA